MMRSIFLKYLLCKVSALLYSSIFYPFIAAPPAALSPGLYPGVCTVKSCGFFYGLLFNPEFTQSDIADINQTDINKVWKNA